MICSFLTFAAFTHSKASDLLRQLLSSNLLHTLAAVQRRCCFLPLAAQQLCSWRLMCVHVISDLLWGWAASWKKNVHICLLVVITNGALTSCISDSPHYMSQWNISPHSFALLSSPDTMWTQHASTVVCQSNDCSQLHQSPFGHKPDAPTAGPNTMLIWFCLTFVPVLIILMPSMKCQQKWERCCWGDDCNHDGDSQVIVRVLGANLYSPVFSQRFYLAEVQENAPPGSKVIQVSVPSHYLPINVPIMTFHLKFPAWMLLKNLVMTFLFFVINFNCYLQDKQKHKDMVTVLN